MFMRSFTKFGSVMFVLLVTVHILHAQNQTPPANPPSAAAVEAGKLFQSQQWAEAAAAYERLIKAEPGNGMAWFRLGASLSALKKYEQAIAPLQKAVELLRGPMANYLLGATYASLGDKDKAFASLSEATRTGFAQLNRLQNDPSLAALREDPRFSKLVEEVRRVSSPCLYSDKAKELDFWVGEWDVQVNGVTAGINVIQRIEDGCVIMENWKGQGGLTGKSMNFYNPALGKWRQTYVGSNASIWEMEGEYKEGAMRFSGQVFAPNGQAVMTRVIFYNLEPGRLRHTAENSSDQGKTWTTVWDAIYVRKTTASQ